MTAVETAFRGGIELVNPDKSSAIPTSFVVQLAYELSPSHIADGFGKTVILAPILDLQTRGAYELVLPYELCGQFVVIVSSSIPDTNMDPCYLVTGFSTVLTAFFL